MNIDSWKTLRSYTNILENVTINGSIKLFPKHPGSPLPGGITDNSPISPVLYVSGKTQVQENILVHFMRFWIPKKILLSAG